LRVVEDIKTDKRKREKQKSQTNVRAKGRVLNHNIPKAIRWTSPRHDVPGEPGIVLTPPNAFTSSHNASHRNCRIARQYAMRLQLRRIPGARWSYPINPRNIPLHSTWR